MRFGQAHLTNIWLRTRRSVGGLVAFGALLFGAIRCADLTAPAAVGNVSIEYSDPASDTIAITVGDTVAPVFNVMIGSQVQQRARYVYSVGSGSTRLEVIENGSAIRVLDRGSDTVFATVVGATIGGPSNGAKLVDTLWVIAAPASNAVDFPANSGSNPGNISAIGAQRVLNATSKSSQGVAVAGGKVRWYSTDAAIVSVADSVGLTVGDTSRVVISAVGNGSANILAIFEDIDTVATAITVQQQFSRFRVNSSKSTGSEILFKSLTDTVTVVPIPQDANNNDFQAGAGATPPAATVTFGLTSSASGRVQVNASTGLLTSSANTSLTDPVKLAVNVNGLPRSDSVTVKVEQEAVSLTIVGVRVDTIPSLGGEVAKTANALDSLGQGLSPELIQWSTGDPSIASVTGNNPARVLANAVGTTTLVATSVRGNRTDQITLVVRNDPDKIALSPDTLRILSLNDTVSFSPPVITNTRNNTLSGIPVTYHSLDSTIAEPLANGSIWGKKVGITRVFVATPAPNSKVDTSRVEVTNAPSFIDITPTSQTLTSVGDSIINIPVTLRNTRGDLLVRAAANWRSGNESVARVTADSAKTIIATGVGDTYIYAQSPIDSLNVKDSVRVVVSNNTASLTTNPSTAQTLNAFGATINFTATARNTAGNVITGATITWSVTSGGAFLSIDPATGVASALANGAATVRATSGGITADVPVTVAQAYSSARSTIIPTAPSLVATGATSTTITVQLKDANDNNLAFGGSTVVLAVSPAGIGTLSGVTDAGNGAYTATLTSGTTSGTATISATVGGIAVANNGIVAMMPGAPARYVVTSTSSTPVAGTSVTIRAQLADANGNPVATAGNAVTFTSTNGGTFTGANPATTDGTGAAQITFNTSATVASHTITATTGGLTGSSAAINSIAGGATNYFVTPTTTSPAAGSVQTITAQLRDANGNAVALPDSVVTWTKSDANGSFSGGGSSTTNASGVATIDFTAHTASSTATTITATTGSKSGTSATVTTVPAAPSAAQTTATVPAGTVGAVTSITVQARDAFSNSRTSSSGTVAALVSGANSTTASVIDNGNGTYTVTYTPTSAGTDNIAITLGGAAIGGSPYASVVSTATLSANAVLSVTQNGNEAGPLNIVYTVTLSAANTSGAAITFTVVNSAGGTATSGSDFTAFGPTTMSVAPGASTGTLTVTVLDDAVLEGTETVPATISAPSNGGIAITGATATANLADNDGATASLSVTTHGTEAGTDIVYTVTLNTANNTGAAITFDIDDAGTGTATSGSDYTVIPGAATITVANGASTGTLTVTVSNDALLEATETVQATISNSSNPAVSIGTASATASITDNDTATADIAVVQQGDENGTVNLIFGVTLSVANNTGAPITFDLAKTGGSAAAADHGAVPATISVADGATSGTAIVTVVDDALLELDLENIELTISNPSNPAVAITGPTATATIAESGATAILSANSPTEGNDIVFTVTLSKPNATGAAVTFDIDDAGTGTATSGTDYTAIPGAATISVANGSSTGTLTVTVLNDALLEVTETIQATISNSSAGPVTITGATTTANLLDNETATAALSVTTHGNEAGPVNIVYTVTLNRTNTTGAPITFAASHSGGTATSGSDFTAFGGATAISVANGASTGTLTVPVLTDAQLEGTETVEAAISDPSLGGQITITTPTATANITEAGATANLSVTTHGNEAGPVNIVYTVTLTSTNTTGSAITFDIDDLATGTAAAGSDYAAIPGAATISVANGASTGTLTVTVLDDAQIEAVETLIAGISNSSNPAVGIGTASATANITSDDVTTANLSVTTQGNETGPVNIVYTVTLGATNNTGSTITFDLDDAGTGTATSALDYNAIPGAATISVANGASTGTFTVTVINDALLENTETVIATISNSSSPAVTVGTASATANITESGATANLSVTTQGNEAGPVNIVYTVTLTKTNVTGSAVTFDIVDDATGTATSAADYTAIAGGATISVANGASTGTFSVTVIDDALLENTETVNTTISNSTNADVGIGTASASANIIESGATANLSVTQQGAEPGTNVEYTVTLTKTNVTGSAVTFDIDDAGTGTAVAGTDYTAIAGAATISVADAASTGTFNVAVLDDALLDGTRTVVATISNSSNGSAAVGTANATADITDDETATANLSVTTQGNEAGPVNIVYTVTLTSTNNTGSAITFDIDDAGSGTATSGADYTAIGAAATVSVANGASTGTFTVTVIDDVLLENTETVDATISNSSLAAVTVGTATASANVAESGATANLSVTQQGAEPGTDIVYTVTLTKTNVTGSAVTFDIDDAGTGTATSASDYSAIAVAATISVADAASTGTFTVTVLNDALFENAETVIATISNSSLGSVGIGTASASANIAEEGATVSLSAQTNGQELGPVDIVFRVTLSKTNVTGANVSVTLTDDLTGSATSGSDYTAFGGTVNIADGTSFTDATVNVLDAGGILTEGEEDVDASISGPSPAGVTLGPATATATIQDNGVGADDDETTNVVDLSLNFSHPYIGTVMQISADRRASDPSYVLS